MTEKKLSVSYIKKFECYTTIEITEEQYKALQVYIKKHGDGTDEPTDDLLEAFISEHCGNVSIERREEEINSFVDVNEITGDE